MTKGTSNLVGRNINFLCLIDSISHPDTIKLVKDKEL